MVDLIVMGITIIVDIDTMVVVTIVIIVITITIMTDLTTITMVDTYMVEFIKMDIITIVDVNTVVVTIMTGDIAIIKVDAIKQSKGVMDIKNRREIKLEEIDVIADQIERAEDTRT